MDSTFNDLIEQAVAQLYEYKSSKKLKDIIRVQTLVTELLGLYVPNDERCSSDESPSMPFRSPYETEVFPTFQTFSFSAPIHVPAPSTPKGSTSVSQVATDLLRFSYDGNENKFKHRHVN